MSLAGRPSQRAHAEAKAPGTASSAQTEHAWLAPDADHGIEAVKWAQSAVAKTRATSAGCATSLADGTHWHRHTQRTEADVPSETRRCVTALLALQMLDDSTPVAPDPWILDVPTAAALLAVADGRAVGFLLLEDRDRDGNLEVLGDIWTAPGVRRRGVATTLLARARAEHDLRRAEPPILDDGRRLLEAVAPDLLPGRRPAP
jgi:hypothetical protein